MPLYDYTCEKCQKQFEMMRSIKESSTAKCPVCGSECKKSVSAPSFQLKGSGWYKTDYKKKDSSEKKDLAHSANCACCPHKKEHK